MTPPKPGRQQGRQAGHRLVRQAAQMDAAATQPQSGEARPAPPGTAA